MSWEDAEPGLRTAQVELQLVTERARRRPFAVLATALFGTALVSGMVAYRTRMPRAHAVVRIVEPITSGSGRLTNRQLRGLVEEVALSTANLTRVLQTAGMLAPGQDPALASADLRRRVEVEVAQNNAIALMPPEDRPRAVYVTLWVRLGNPALALTVAREIGALVVKVGASDRVATEQARVRTLNLTIVEDQARLQRLQGEIARLSADPASAATLAVVRAELRGVEDRLSQLERARGEAQLALDAERRGQGAEIALIDPELEHAPARRWQRVGTAAAVAFPVLLPICVLLVGAFDPMVGGARDVARLGLRSLGHVRGLRRRGASVDPVLK